MQFSNEYEYIRLHDRAKIPLQTDWPNVQPLNLEQYLKIIGLGGNCGVRLKESQLVIDVDPRNGGDYRALGFDIFAFPVVKTPSGGYHIYMRLPPGVEIHHTVKAFPGIEFKTKGRQVVAPGSIHPNGGVYVWDEFSAVFPAGFIPTSLLLRIRVEAVVPSNVTGEWTAEQLQQALSKLDVEEFGNHEKWFALMCAAHEATAGQGEEAFARWSVGDELYAMDEKIIRQRWNTLKSGKTGNAGAGTLLHILVSHGVTDLQFKVDEFAGMGVGETTTDGSSADDVPPVAVGRSALADINARFYVVQEDGKLRILELRENEETKVKTWIRHSKKDFLEVAQSTYHYPMIELAKPDGKSKTISLAQHWIEKNLKGKRVYPGGVVFMPEVNAEKVGESLNLWRGFAFEPKAGDWSLLKTVIKDVLCRSDEESFIYVLNWLARSVQQPHIPAGTACVFKGSKGTGKGTLGRAFVKIFGVHGKHIGSMGAITGRFNSHLRDCVALFADEAYWAGDRSGESMLKALITEPTMLYEAKGLTPIMGRNCTHILMASNLDWVIPAGLDQERRFAMFETIEEIKPFEFWRALNQQLDSGGYAAMLHELLDRDISGFNVHAVPQTAALAEQKIESMDLGEQWLFALLMSGDWGGLPMADDNMLLANDLQLSFMERLGNRRSPRAIETQIGMVLRKFIPGVKRIRINRPENRIDISNLRPWAYQLPPIDEAKNKFIRMLGRDVFAEGEI